MTNVTFTAHECYNIRRKMTTQLETFLTSAMNIHDPYFVGHDIEVVRLSLMIALEIDDNVDIGDLQMGARLHDLGKIFVPEGLINKQTKLDSMDINALRNHTTLGHYVLSPLLLPFAVTDVVLHHHENYDGSGYPHGLIGGSIPIHSRIVRLANSYAAMTANRPYRLAKTKEEAIAEIEAGSRIAYDPRLASVFVNALKKERQGFVYERYKEE